LFVFVKLTAKISVNRYNGPHPYPICSRILPH